MRLSRLQWSAIALAVVAFAMLLFVHWAWSWPFNIASWTCSAMAVRQSRRAKKIREAREEHAAWLPALPRTGRRAFEPFCECPGCGLPTYHVFGAPREQIDEARPSRWMVGLADVWQVNHETVQVWNSPGVYKVGHLHVPDEAEAQPKFSTVVDRECLSCGHEWTEAVS